MRASEIDTSTGEARTYIFALVKARPESAKAALGSVARSIGISRWSLAYLYYGRRKFVGYNVLIALRREYLKLCERQIAKLEAELVMLRGGKKGGDDFQNLGSAVDRVVAQVREARRNFSSGSDP